LTFLICLAIAGRDDIGADLKAPLLGDEGSATGAIRCSLGLAEASQSRCKRLWTQAPI